MTSEIQYHNNECKQYPDEKKNAAILQGMILLYMHVQTITNFYFFFVKHLVTEFHTFVALLVFWAATMHACVSRSGESYCSVNVCYCPISVLNTRINESKQKKGISHAHCKWCVYLAAENYCCWYLLETPVDVTFLGCLSF